jgi:Fe-S cluster assembly scaffold protein SufB
MKNFSVPFIIDSPNAKDYVLAKCYEKKGEAYRLSIPSGKRLEKPITIRFRSDEKRLDISLELILEKNASATIIEEWSKEVHSPIIRFESRISCHTNAALKLIILNQLTATAELSEERTSVVSENAKCLIYGYFFGGKRIASRLLQTSAGSGAELSSDIVAKSSSDQHLSFYCEHRYSNRQGSGEIGMKGIAQKNAELNFDGLISITKAGGGSSGYLKQEILNLSPQTTVRAVPGLTIETNDVKAGHSASVRNLNDEDLYYFGARGIEKETAKKLLITGFLGKELKKIEDCAATYETIRKLI